MRWVFWSSVAMLAYTYFGYPAWLWMRGQSRKQPVKTAESTPSISILMVVRNEAAVIEGKLQNLLAINYPRELTEIIVVSDGSIDDTNEILGQYGSSGSIRAIINADTRGKAACLNDAIWAARSEIVVFTDARQKIEPGAVRLLVTHFADLKVGCASGELMLGDAKSGEEARGLGLYWRIEKGMREMESASGSMVGATGALYAVRRSLLVPLPAGTILDDVYIPLQVVRQGFRAIFVSRARAWDIADQGTSREFSRKVRTLTGNYQLVQLAPWLLGSSNPLRFEFVSHKLLRLFAPFALGAAFTACLMLPQAIYRVALLLQLCFYALSLIAMMKLARGPVARVADAARTFVVLNSAAVVAFIKFVTGQRAAWVR